MRFSFSSEVGAALKERRPVVALESTLIAHGFDFPENLEVGRGIEDAVRERGAVPATIAVIDGEVRVGLTADEMQMLATQPRFVKLSLRDLCVCMGTGSCGATTVASTAFLASQAGIRVFATGGLGGVHRGARDTWDVSGDLLALGQSPIVVVCSGAKSLLDIGATLEVLESDNVPVLGFKTDRFPGFYVRDSGFPVPWRVDDVRDVAAVYRAQDDLGLHSAIVVANPVPKQDAIDSEIQDAWIASALGDLDREGIRGKLVTPFLLRRIKELSGAESVRANRALIISNAALAAEIAVEIEGTMPG